MIMCNHIVGYAHVSGGSGPVIIVLQSSVLRPTQTFNFCPTCGLPLGYVPTQREKRAAGVGDGG